MPEFQGENQMYFDEDEDIATTTDDSMGDDDLGDDDADDEAEDEAAEAEDEEETV